MRIVFQGVPGAYSEVAARQLFPKTKPVGLPTFSDVFSEVAKRRADRGVIPIENSLTGSIHENYDLLEKHAIGIVGEIKLRIRHSLLALPGTSLSDVREVYSHPQGLLQCAGFLKRLPRAKPMAYFDTAGSARLLAERKLKGAAAIASDSAAGIYHLKTLKRGIEDNRHNYTRFLVLSLAKPKRSRAASKTSLLFTLKNLPGALYLSLGCFAERKIQLLKVESRPIPGRPWEYRFYLDFGDSAWSAQARAALKALERSARDLRVLGSYPPA